MGSRLCGREVACVGEEDSDSRSGSRTMKHKKMEKEEYGSSGT